MTKTLEDKEKARQEIYSKQAQEDIDQNFKTLETIWRDNKSLDALLAFHKDICDQSLEEIKAQAHVDSETWKYEKILRNYDEESERVSEVIQRLSTVIWDTQRRLQEITEHTKKMQEEQKEWRKEKEIDFDRQTHDLNEKITMNTTADGGEDENAKLQEHYTKLVE